MTAFLKSVKRKDIFRKTVCYGLISTSEKIDIMSASIALANYFASAKGYRTALVLNGEDQAELQMLSEMKCEDVDPVGYSDEYLTYYVVTNAGEMRELKNKDYERIVLKTDARQINDELVRETDHIRIFGDVSPWRYNDIRTTMRDSFRRCHFLEQGFGNCLYTASARDKDIERFRSEFNADVIQTGFFRDPYRLERTDLVQVEKLL